MNVKSAGTKGGHARAKALTPMRRSEIARWAAKARWEKKNGVKNDNRKTQ